MIFLDGFFDFEIISKSIEYAEHEELAPYSSARHYMLYEQKYCIFLFSLPAAYRRILLASFLSDAH